MIVKILLDGFGCTFMAVSKTLSVEENVVSVVGAPHRFTSNGIQEAIREAGFIPKLRTQQYEHRQMPEVMEQQVINY